MDKVLQYPQFQIKLSKLLVQDWFEIGIYLKVKPYVLEAIRNDSINLIKQEDKAYEMIKKWFDYDENPTFEKLKRAISSIPKFKLLKEVEDFAKKFDYDDDGDDADNDSETLLNHIGLLKTYETSNLPESAYRISVNKDISEICTALKRFYLTNYGKICEVQPPLKLPANVDLMHKFVDLCIVDAVNTQRDAVFSVERKEFLEKQLRYTPIPYSKIFMKEISVTLISGIAGIGKTWLLRKCLLDWSNGLIWENVKLVFYLECRRLNLYQNIGNINELVNFFYKEIINDFDISIYPALFVIDGLDEFKYLNELINPSSSCSYPIVNALTEIQKYKYVLAGRVYAIDKYQSISTEHCDKINIQIMGFNERGINNYIENNVLKENKDVVKATLKESAIAKSMSSVPFYLSSMCKIISNSKNLYKSSFLTMTDLYANIFLYFLQKHIIKNNELIYQLMENNSNKKYILNICKIAYQMFIENRVIFSKEDIQTFIIDFDKDEESFFGFIERIETNLGYLYQFAHLTIMEFCASVYAYNCLSSVEIIANEKLDSCLSMICGLANKNQSSLLKFLVNLNPLKETFKESLSLFFVFERLLELSLQNQTYYYYKHRTYYVNLFIECFYESQSSFTDEIKLIVNERKWEISIKDDDGKTSYETSCENYFVNHYIKSGRKLSWLFVDKNILSDEEKNFIIKCSTNVRYVVFHCPIKFEEWKPKDKIERLWINISRYLTTKKDFEENFLPWINLCEGLDLSLHDDIDFIEEIRCSNVKWLTIKYRGKDFYNLDELKNFITQKKMFNILIKI
ncbi:uncharacterized protein LOC136076695 isoform X2 [Hydra vulgaris]|uniref:Uncharacterized protein LOC136076695 isoform X2 n=1 Tax=Hydra vulgaris TaxID=6087 RepID=A0ABM4BB19_HYDVU